MARYKHIRPTFKNPKLEERIKLKRRITYLNVIWIATMLIICVILFVLRHNRILLGCGGIFLGMVSFGFTLLFDHLMCQDPEPLLWCDYDDDFENTNNPTIRKQREQAREKLHLAHDLPCVLWLLFSFSIVLLGILRLCGVL